ncbi:MAG: lipopolysaccharide transport periplasmic protein LptA [candidate division NC10 bacterium]|nr:lipopolysaccharide transport periplasmic protein LptA [candidate division NC10 bacterium]MBI3003478.1 lipopolysaccharide transport periplasmic protein LptA [candidate division NC10 bacterium]MBI4391666.1 lipopolysaccharide transport periplasmic protein LptA [candidate division NC10 bacterium]
MRGALLVAVLLAAAAPAAAEAPPTVAGGGRAPKAGAITITADRLEVDRKAHTATYAGNVVARDSALTILADRMEFTFDEAMQEVRTVRATGRVRIAEQGGREATADAATYFAREEKVLLEGNARAWQEENVVTGTTMTLYLREDRHVVEGEGNARVHAIIYPRRDPGGAPRP